MPTHDAPATGRLTLHAATAADLMAVNPVSIRREATLREAVAFMMNRDFTAAPVMDTAGRVVGIVSQTDLLFHTHRADGGAGPRGVPDAELDTRTVADVMADGVWAVPPTAPAATVVAKMLAHHVHRLFVIDGDGTLVGVIGLFDILHRLRL